MLPHALNSGDTPDLVFTCLRFCQLTRKMKLFSGRCNHSMQDTELEYQLYVRKGTHKSELRSNPRSLNPQNSRTLTFPLTLLTRQHFLRTESPTSAFLAPTIRQLNNITFSCPSMLNFIDVFVSLLDQP